MIGPDASFANEKLINTTYPYQKGELDGTSHRFFIVNLYGYLYMF